MGQPFPNPIAAGNGAMVIPQFQSPNFDQAGQTGWAIYQNGDAYFFNITASGDISATEFIGTDFVMDSSGIFFYSGTPAAGNLIASIAPAAGIDGYGNAFLPGTVSYANIGGFYYAVQHAADGMYWWSASSVAGPYSQDGPVVNYSSGLGLSSGQSAAGATAAQLILQDSDLSPLGMAIAQAIATIVATQPGGSSPETWHAIPLASGWSTVSGQPVPSYKLLPDGRIAVAGSATHATFTGSTALSTAGGIPAAYRPVREQFVGGGPPTNASVEITTAGTVNALPPSGGTGTVQFNGAYPVDL